MIAETPDGAVLDVRVVPRAGASGLAGTRHGALLVRVTAAPVDGAANDAVLAVLAAALALPRRQLAIISGHTNRAKRVKVSGVRAAQVRARLGLADDDR